MQSFKSSDNVRVTATLQTALLSTAVQSLASKFKITKPTSYT